MGHLHDQPLEFKFEGQFLGFVSSAEKPSLPKYLRVRVLSEEMQIKIPKALRLSGRLKLQPGEQILVTGRGKFDPDLRELKLKAAQINSLTDHLTSHLTSDDAPIPDAPVAIAPVDSLKPKIKLLVCQKSGCLKKGGKGLCEALQQTLRQRNLSHLVTIKPTGCLKCCSSAPNLIMMPGNQRYKAVCSQTLVQIADAVAQTLAQSLETNETER